MTKQPTPAGTRSRGFSRRARSDAQTPAQVLRKAAIFAACMSCSVALDADRLQCDADTDCARRGFDGARCDEGLCLPRSELDGVVASRTPALEPPAVGASERAPDGARSAAAPPNVQRSNTEALPGVRYELRFELPRLSDLEPDDLDLRLCRLEDEVCAGEGSAALIPDATGLLALELDAGFRGYLEVDAPDLVPTLAALPRPHLPDAEPVAYRLLEQRDYELLLRRGDLPHDGDRGFAIALVHDAAGARASGGQLSLSEVPQGDSYEAAVSYYFSGGIPTRHAESTDEQGAGGWSRLPAGVLSAQAQHHGSGAFMGAAAFRSRPGHVSIVPLHPEARP